ncbi:hypothetical protein [Streptomyces bluensis]|uniref:hypothetical protein n=1 Tax=Streptomyces bluensis TaxID=33897 RepID=UPI00331B0954
MPEAALDAVADHAVLRAGSIRDTYGEAHQVLDDLAGLGVDYDDVVQVLEGQGVETFPNRMSSIAADLLDWSGDDERAE